MSDGIPAPDVDLSAPIYNDTPESRIVPTVGDPHDFDEDYDVCETVDEFLPLRQRLDRIEEKLEALTDGVNTIGTMMNGVADAFGQIMAQVQKGGIGSLLGGMMGGKKNDD